MTSLITRCSRTTLILGTAILLGAMVPDHAGATAAKPGHHEPLAASAQVQGCPDSAARSPEAPEPAPVRPALLLAQGPPSPETSQQEQQRRLKEQEEQLKRLQQQEMKGQKSAPAPPRQAEQMKTRSAPPGEVPAKSDTRRFGAQPIRSKPPVDQE
jgi:hypothetical protein